MTQKLIFMAFLVIYSVSVLNGHQIVKRQNEVTDGLVSATHEWTNFLSNTWNSLRDSLRRNESESQSRINQIHANLTNWRNNLINASSDVAQDLRERLHNMTNHLNVILRERANNDQNLVHHLYNMIINTTRNGTNHSLNTLRNAFTTATQTMAENYSGLANSSIQLASVMRDKGTELYNTAMIRASNDTNRAVIAANTAINIIRNSSQPINETIQQVVVDLAESAHQLSAKLRELMNQTTSIETEVQDMVPDFRQRAEQSLQKLMTNMDQLRNSLRQFSTSAQNNTTSTDCENNLEDNEIDVIGRTAKALSREYGELQKQINAMRTQS